MLPVAQPVVAFQLQQGFAERRGEKGFCHEIIDPGSAGIQLENAPVICRHDNDRFFRRGELADAACQLTAVHVLHFPIDQGNIERSALFHNHFDHINRVTS